MIEVSTYESDDSIRSAVVYKDHVGYKVIFNDRKDRTVTKTNYSRLSEAENKAEDWVMYE